MAQTYTHALSTPTCQVVLQGRLKHGAEQQTAQRATLFRPPLYHEHIALFVCQDRRLNCGSIPNCASAFHNELCLIVTNASMKSTVAIHILTK